MVFHVHGYDGCAPFSKELTRGWGQAVELLGSVGQVLEMAGWSVQPWLPDIVVLDGQACHIYSTSWEDFHKLSRQMDPIFTCFGSGLVMFS